MRKKTGVIVTLILLLLMSCMVFASAEAQSGAVYFGDVDGDGSVSASDARAILRHSAKIEMLADSYLGVADVDADGSISAVDARMTLRMAAGLEALKEYHTHEYVATQTKAATCTEDGIMEYRCSGCGDTYTEAIPATGEHDYVKTVKQEANCETDGIIEYKCSKCGDTYTETIPATGKHDYVSSVTKEPTYNDNGEATYTCSICGHSYTEVVYALKISNPVYIHMPETPITVNNYNWNDRLESTFIINEMSYSTKYHSSYYDYALYFSLSGEKTFDSEGDSTSRASKIGWKLYDAEGYVVESGTIYTEGIKNNEKTKVKDYIASADLLVGEYTLEILNVG